MAATSEGLVAFLLHSQGREKFSRLTQENGLSENYIFPEPGKSCHMETARSSSLHYRPVDTGAELKLKPFGSQNSQISIGNPRLLPTPKVRQPKSLEREGAAGFGGQLLDAAQKGIPLLLLRKLGAAVTIALHPAPSRRRSLLQLPCAGLERVGQGWCAPKLAFLAANILGSQPPGPTDPGLRAGRETEAVGRQEPSQGSSSCYYSLTNMAAADADAACPGRAPSRSRRGSTSRQRCCRRSLINTQSLLREGGRPRAPRAPSQLT